MDEVSHRVTTNSIETNTTRSRTENCEEKFQTTNYIERNSSHTMIVCYAKCKKFEQLTKTKVTIANYNSINKRITKNHGARTEIGRTQRGSIAQVRTWPCHTCGASMRRIAFTKEFLYPPPSEKVKKHF